MVRFLLFALSLTALVACADETISGFADTSATYRLVLLDGSAFDATASIAFPTKGRAEGTGPCNAWSATQSVPYPWIAFGPISSTKQACPKLGEEAAFFDALQQMSLAEVQGPVLILTNDEGREMVFDAN